MQLEPLFCMLLGHIVLLFPQAPWSSQFRFHHGTTHALVMTISMLQNDHFQNMTHLSDFIDTSHY